MPTDPRAAGGRAARGEPSAVARFIGYAVNPLVLPPVLFALVVAHFGASAAEVLRVAVVALVCFVVVPLAYVVHLVRSRRIASVEIPERRHRTRPFLVGMAASATALGIFAATGGPAAPLLVAMTASHAVNTLLLLVVNLRWKISVHASAVAAFVSVMGFVLAAMPPGVVPPEALALPALTLGAVALPLVMWARVRIGVHTPAQVGAGALAGLVLPSLELLLFQALGLLPAL